MALSPSRAEDPRDDRLSDPLRQAADTMRAVRDRCVWTQQIDHRALVPYLVEESAELIDAIEAGPRAEMREELGDLLWQVLFHAEIASRDAEDPFDIDSKQADQNDIPYKCSSISTEAILWNHPTLSTETVGLKGNPLLLRVPSPLRPYPDRFSVCVLDTKSLTEGFWTPIP